MGELLAKKFLIKNKYRILATNLRTHFGEVDILASQGQTLIIVEVKTKTSDQRGSAIEMVNPAKQKKLILLTLELQKTYQTNNVRIDIITIDQASEKPLLKHWKGVIEYHG